MSISIRCENTSCKCSVEAEHAVKHGGKSYCSQRCADNRGCDHHGCNCGVFPTQEPASASHSAKH